MNDPARFPVEEYQIRETVVVLNTATWTQLVNADPTRWSLIISPPSGSTQDLYVSIQNDPTLLQGIYVNNTTLPFVTDWNKDRALISGPLYGRSVHNAVNVTVTEVRWRPHRNDGA